MLSRQGSGGHVTSARAAGPPGPLPLLQEGGFSTWGDGGGGEAEASGRLPLEGLRLRSPLPRRVGEGGEDLHTGRESAPASEQRERPDRVIKEEVVFSPPQHLHLHPAGPHFLSSVPLTEMFIKQQQHSDPQEMK